jgi:hypothetical protein
MRASPRCKPHGRKVDHGRPEPGPAVGIHSITEASEDDEGLLLHTTCGLLPAVSLMAEMWTMGALSPGQRLESHAITEASEDDEGLLLHKTCGLLPTVSLMAEIWTMGALSPGQRLESHAITEAPGGPRLRIIDAYEMWSVPAESSMVDLTFNAPWGQQVAEPRYHRGIRAQCPLLLRVQVWMSHCALGPVIVIIVSALEMSLCRQYRPVESVHPQALNRTTLLLFTNSSCPFWQRSYTVQRRLLVTWSVFVWFVPLHPP